MSSELLPSAFLLLPFPGPIYKLFGKQLPKLLDELNETVAASAL